MVTTSVMASDGKSFAVTVYCPDFGGLVKLHVPFWGFIVFMPKKYNVSLKEYMSLCPFTFVPIL
jgi:hypothetical protein